MRFREREEVCHIRQDVRGDLAKRSDQLKPRVAWSNRPLSEINQFYGTTGQARERTNPAGTLFVRREKHHLPFFGL